MISIEIRLPKSDRSLTHSVISFWPPSRLESYKSARHENNSDNDYADILSTIIHTTLRGKKKKCKLSS